VGAVEATPDGVGVALAIPRIIPGIANPSPMSAPERLRLEIRGAVQGVGFRPFVYRLAHELRLRGWVRNGVGGVELEVEGERPALERFAERLPRELPPAASIQALERRWLAAAGFPDFAIRESGSSGEKRAVVLPERATCAACRAEIADPAARRYRYPFTNCTHCGPRFTIVEALPYDRPHTTMRGFAMCADCAAEYGDPADRRFHAQPIACPACGPRLELCDARGGRRALGDDALRQAAAALRGGAIVALKGLGGYQLLCDARSAAAVAALRARKRRPSKPLALMAPDLESTRAIGAVGAGEEALLASAEAPIALLIAHPSSGIAPNVAPGNPRLGVMLPTSPLHHLLMDELGFPVVATSGNLTDEPIATDDDEALRRLGGIADLFLRHDRPIARHADDSVAWVHLGAPRLLRRARGYAPLPIALPRPGSAILAVGAHLKNTVALALGDQAFVSQHLGDMETPEARAAAERAIADFLRLYEAVPVAIAHDLHPEYATTRWARTAGERRWAELGAAAPVPCLGVQHHHAHLASCLADNGLDAVALGVTWDGTGYGPDGTIWGGELLLGSAASYRRVARLRPFRLPGGDAAVREPRRVALALLHQIAGNGAFERTDLPALASFTGAERRLLGRMLESGTGSPWTSSAGRLFDGVAALLGLSARVTYEGQAAMELEFLAGNESAEGAARMEIVRATGHDGERADAELLELDWRALVAELLAHLGRGVSAARLAARFHGALARAIADAAHEIQTERVALSGGCFQNRRLTELAAAALGSGGHTVLLHRQVPANDGGISLGQVAVAAARLAAPGATPRRVAATREGGAVPGTGA